MATRRTKMEMGESGLMGQENSRARGNDYTKKGVKKKQRGNSPLTKSVKFIQRLFRKKVKNASKRVAAEKKLQEKRSKMELKESKKKAAE